jgi:hypothetical protein
VLPDADDLKLINGIGPAVESRLHGIGILTFAQLAALSPADIAASVSDLSGLTTERIIKQDWIGQARRLAASSKPTQTQESEETELAFPVVPEPEPVTIEELESALPAAPEHIALTVTSPGTKEAEITPPADSKIGLGDKIRILKMEVVSGNNDMPPNYPRHDQPYTVRLTLELTGDVSPVNKQFNYKAYLFCKNLESHSRRLAGEASGTLTINGNIIIDVKGTEFPGGVNLLQALIALWPTTENTITPTSHRALSDVSILQFI